MNGKEVGGDLHYFIRIKHVVLTRTCPYQHEKGREACIKTSSKQLLSSPPASLLFKGQVTQHTTVKWAIVVAEGGGEYEC